MGSRGILSSMGTGLTLVIAGVLACVAIIGAVAFKGFPEMSPAPPSQAVVMPSAAARAATERQPVVLGAALSAEAARRRGEAGRTRSSRDLRRGGRGRARDLGRGRDRARDRRNAPATRADDRPGGKGSPQDGSRPSSAGAPDGSRSAPGQTDDASPVPAEARPVVDQVREVVDRVPEVPLPAPSVPSVPVPSVPVPSAAQPVVDKVDKTVAPVTGLLP